MAQLFCKRFVLAMRPEPLFAVQACNGGSGNTWQKRTKGTKTGRLQLKAWNVGSDGRWQGRTRTNIGRAVCEKGILLPRSNAGSGGRWQWKTGTNIDQRNCNKGISLVTWCLLSGVGWQWKTRTDTDQKNCDRRYRSWLCGSALQSPLCQGNCLL